MRDHSLDFFRIIAAFFVITLHVGYYSNLGSDEIGSSIRLLGRWAIPFFFMLTGYFLVTKINIDKIFKSLSKLTFIFVLSSMAFLPLPFLLHVYRGESLIETASLLFDSSLFIEGTTAVRKKL